MTLAELCEPILQYVCRLNRIGRGSVNLDLATVRAEINGLLADAARNSQSTVRLAAQYKKIELPLIFFIDSMIAESKLKFAKEWHYERLAFDRKELAGDEKFFDLLEETMSDTSDEGVERLEVFYTCLGLGFTGMYAGQPEFLRKTMMTIAPKIRHLMDTDLTRRVTEEAYQGVDTRDLVQPPGGRLVVLGVILLIALVSVTVAYVWMFKSASGDLTRSLDTIAQKESSVRK